MPHQPFFWRKPLELFPKTLIDLIPRRLDYRSRRHLDHLFVCFGHKGIVKFRMKPFAEPQHCQQTIVHRRDMAPDIDQAVPAGCDLCQELFFRQIGKDPVGTTNHELPRTQGRINCKLLDRH